MAGKNGEPPVIDILVARMSIGIMWLSSIPTKWPNFIKAFDIKQLWLAWTENPADPEAALINGRLRKGAAALEVAASRLQAAERRKRLSSRASVANQPC